MEISQLVIIGFDRTVVFFFVRKHKSSFVNKEFDYEKIMMLTC